MSDEKMYTEREMVKAQRAAFVIGWHRGCSLDDAFGVNVAAARASAEKRFLFPKVTRRRVVRDSAGIEWTIFPPSFDGDVPEINWRDTIPLRAWGAVHDNNAPTITPERITLLADLLANPTEEVDA